MKPSALTWIELFVVIFLVVVAFHIFLPNVTPAWSAQQRALCQDNLKRLGQALRIYSSEDPRRLYPPMHGYERFGSAANAPGCANVHDDFDFAPDMRALFPACIDDPLALVCPAGPYGVRPRLFLGRVSVGHLGYTEDAPDAPGPVRDYGAGACEYVGLITDGDVSYTYLPWLTTNASASAEALPSLSPEAAVAAGLAAYGPANLVAVAEWLRRARQLAPATSAASLDQDIDLAHVLSALGEPYTCPAGAERPMLPRLRSGLLNSINGARASSPQTPDNLSEATIPVLYDDVRDQASAFNHPPGGANVLYMDGHVEFVRYPENFPCSEEWARIRAAAQSAP